MALVTFPERKVTRPRCGNRVGCDGSRSYRYTYNAQRQRTRKILGSETTVFHYDLAGNLIAETKADGTLIKDYVWLDSSPIAQVANGEKLTYLHTDHLQTPRLATNPQGTVVWRWEGTAFGATLPNEDVDNDTVRTTINLRFPGQYYDGESGLHYNWNRYYDPKIGRYITSDPIGLDGGINTYAYTMTNPLRFTDPDGLKVLFCCRLLDSVALGTVGRQRHCYFIFDDDAYGLYPKNGAGVPEKNHPRDKGGDCKECKPKSCSDPGQCIKDNHDFYDIGKYGRTSQNSNTYAGNIARKCCEGGVPSGLGSAPGIDDSPPPPLVR